MTAVLQFADVQKAFPGPRGPVQVLHGIDLDIREGDFVAITGPSGSGKSTFLNLAGLMDRPTGGTLRFDGDDVSTLLERDLSQLRKRGIGMVFQKFCLLPHRSALRNVEFRYRYLPTGPREARARSRAALARVGLASLARQPARLLSGGEMQRVAIARAVAEQPRLLLADEPTGNLDAATATDIMRVFQDLNQDGITILLATHNPALLEYASRHVVFEDGRVVSGQ